MRNTGHCGSGGKAEAGDLFEVVRIEKTMAGCQVCEAYAESRKSKPVAVMRCEGACLRGEVARQAANILCHPLAPEKTVRICLGGAFTKDTGQRALVRNAGRLIALEGCFVNCASRMMHGVIDGLTPEVIVADRLYDFSEDVRDRGDAARADPGARPDRGPTDRRYPVILVPRRMGGRAG